MHERARTLGPPYRRIQLVFTDKDGERYLIVVDDALKRRSAGAESSESMPKQGSQLRPREIQQLLRAGMAPAEIASTYDVELERISRVEAPIIAERNFVINRALTSAVGTEPDSPQLGDLVIDRLATRGVEAQSLSWSALREGREPVGTAPHLHSGGEGTPRFLAGFQPRHANQGAR